MNERHARWLQWAGLICLSFAAGLVELAAGVAVLGAGLALFGALEEARSDH